MMNRITSVKELKVGEFVHQSGTVTEVGLGGEFASHVYGAVVSTVWPNGASDTAYLRDSVYPGVAWNDLGMGGQYEVVVWRTYE